MCARLISEFRDRFSSLGMTPDLVRDFQDEVMEFYAAKGRHDMAWRHTTNPYHIVVSEVMLQQTQVSRVAVKYPQFIETFPDFAALAEAPAAELLAAWQGMGYNRRALSLQKLAQEITGKFCDVLPKDPGILAELPGIGPATSCSIAAFAFNCPVVFIETNIRRVFIHSFFSEEAVVDDRDLLPLVSACLLLGNSREWYWALMDMGTSLKSQIHNPNRRSRQYVKQSAFAGSDRQIRGMALKLLLAGSSADPAELASLIGADPERVAGIFDDMRREGFFERNTNGEYRLSDN